MPVIHSENFQKKFHRLLIEATRARVRLRPLPHFTDLLAQVRGVSGLSGVLWESGRVVRMFFWRQKWVDVLMEDEFSFTVFRET